MFRFSVGSCCSLGAAMPVLALRSALRCLVVVPVDEGRTLAGEEEVLQGACRLVAGNGPRGRVLFLVAAGAVDPEPIHFVLGVPRVPRRSHGSVVPRQEQYGLALLEQGAERGLLPPRPDFSAV